LPQKIDNLISTFCVSATHVAFGTIRVEPTLIQLGEVAGFASFEALNEKINVADLDLNRLQIKLLESNFEISFFNDLSHMNNYNKSINYLGSKGFFTDYNSNKNKDISKSVAEQWAKGFVKLLDKDFDPNILAKNIYISKKENHISITNNEFIEMIKNETNKYKLSLNFEKIKQNNEKKITIGEASEIIYSLNKTNITLVQ